MAVNKGNILDIKEWTRVMDNWRRWYTEHFMYELHIFDSHNGQTYASLEVLEYPSLYRGYALAHYMSLNDVLEIARRDILVREKEYND